jgi:hypothetical protein
LSLSTRILSLIGLLFLLAGCSKSESKSEANTDRDEASVSGEASVQKRSLRVEVEAVFENLPKGSMIIAPVPLDRRYQKITKSEHQGVNGIPIRSVDKENLIFVSEPLEVPKATYKAQYELEARRVMPGVFDSIAGQEYGEFNDRKLKKVLAEITNPAKDPHGIVSEAFETAKKSTEKNAFAMAKTFVSFSKKGGVPTRMVQGLLFREGSALPHTWVEALLPQLGWAPFDPFSARSASESESTYRAQHPPDRIRILFGQRFGLEKSSKREALSVNAPFLGPRAVALQEDGSLQTIEGKVTYSLSSL